MDNKASQTIENEKIKEYRAGSSDREKLLQAIKELKKKVTEISSVVNGKKRSGISSFDYGPPDDHQQIIGKIHMGDEQVVKESIQAATVAKEKWENTKFEERAAVFLRAADLIAGKYRYLMNAATMLGQGKNSYQAEIDCICELVDFLRFNVQYAQTIFNIQPNSIAGVNNSMIYRPLEGFVVAITPFNFTAIAGNLCCAPALMGNTVVWKPSEQQMYSAHFLMKILMEAGLPNGVINMVLVDGPVLGKICFSHPSFAGVHFTGSSEVFNIIWKNIGEQLGQYISYPKIVGETGGKDFVLAHESANIKALVAGLIRGAFEYSGQKCSAASRAYLPSSIWPMVKEELLLECSKIKLGKPEEFTFMNAVISEKAFERIMNYVNFAKEAKDAEIIFGGQGDKSKGYFVEPTVILCTSPTFKTMVEEIFGPVLSIFVYDEKEFLETIQLIDKTSKYALTGAVFAQNNNALQQAFDGLKNAAGNFYINDKPSGAVVNQQPFGGARASGTNDKAGSLLNLLRWVSPRTIKENLSPPESFEYPFFS